MLLKKKIITFGFQIVVGMLYNQSLEPTEEGRVTSDRPE